MTDKQVNGQKSELLAEYFLINKGYVVSKPINDFSEYDFIIDDNGVLHTVQVKTIYFDNSKNRYIASCVTSHIRGNNRRTNKKYTEKSFDYGLFICVEHNSAYLIPIARIAGRRSITFYPNGKHNKTKRNCDDFESYRQEII
jgi:hypothetical protein